MSLKFSFYILVCVAVVFIVLLVVKLNLPKVASTTGTDTREIWKGGISRRMQEYNSLRPMNLTQAEYTVAKSELGINSSDPAKHVTATNLTETIKSDVESKKLSGISAAATKIRDELRLKSKVVILYWTRVFSSTPPVNVDPEVWPFFYAGNNCPIKCDLTTDGRRISEASVLVVHARNVDEMPPARFKNLTWILHTNENPIYSSSLRDLNVMSQFNYLASYRLDSDFPCPEFVKPSLEKPVPFREKKGIMVALSNCEVVRTHFVATLMRHIRVNSYGSCLTNRGGLVGLRQWGAKRAVRELERNYKFTLVFPNADCDYYMTEKIGSALSAGSVPVWMGTDKIDEVLEWGNLKHSVIKVKDFRSPKKLANYLKFLSANETEYNKYLKWKYEGFQFPAEYYKSPIGQWWDGLPLYCRVCMRITKDPKGHDGLPVDNCDGNQTRTMKKWLGINHIRKS